MYVIQGIDVKEKNQTRKLGKGEAHKKVKTERNRQENREARIVSES